MIDVLLLRRVYSDDVKRKCDNGQLKLLNAQKDKVEIVTGSYQEVIDNVNLFDLINFIINLHNAPDCYWRPIMKDGRFDRVDRGQLQWVIYSYLISNGMMVIENEYFDDVRYPSQKNKYKPNDSFDNRFISDLYNPIIDKLVSNRFFIVSGYDYIINVSFIRDEKLKELGI